MNTHKFSAAGCSGVALPGYLRTCHRRLRRWRIHAHHVFAPASLRAQSLHPPAQPTIGRSSGRRSRPDAARWPGSSPLLRRSRERVRRSHAEKRKVG
jgi:hypothetical protein